MEERPRFFRGLRSTPYHTNMKRIFFAVAALIFLGLTGRAFATDPASTGGDPSPGESPRSRMSANEASAAGGLKVIRTEPAGGTKSKIKKKLDQNSPGDSLRSRMSANEAAASGGLKRGHSVQPVSKSGKGQKRTGNAAGPSGGKVEKRVIRNPEPFNDPRVGAKHGNGRKTTPAPTPQ